MEQVEATDGEQILAAVETLYLEQVEGNARLFRHAYDFATMHTADNLLPGNRVLAGRERMVRFGGAGTPLVAEFACVQLGARMQMGPVAAQYYVADALDVWHRLPLIAARLEAGQVKVPVARHVARQTRHLSPEAAAVVDAEMVECADGRLPWSRFCDRLEGRIVAADPETAAARETAARERQFARACRGSEHGIKAFVTRAPIAWVVRFDATVAYLAEALEALGDSDDEEARRVKAWLLLANPTQAVELLAAFAAHRAGVMDQPLPFDDQPEPEAERHEPEPAPAEPERRWPEALARPLPFRPTDLPAWLSRLTGDQVGESTSESGEGEGRRWCWPWPDLLPTVTVFVHVAKETLDRGTGVVRWEEEGPLTFEFFRDHVAPYHRMTVSQVIDLAGQEPVDAYEIPERHRTAVHLRTPADCFPFSSNTSRRVDVDHVKAHKPGGKAQSRMGNYGPLGRFNHRVKTHGHWTVKQPFDGVYVWRDPHGELYLVDHTGTRKITDGRQRRTDRRPARRPTHDDLSVDVYESDVCIDLGFEALH